MSGRGHAFSVAIIGPDGAGKTTVARRLAEELPYPTYYLYMGDNADAVNRSLPTTRLAAALKRRIGRSTNAGPPDYRPAEPRGRGGAVGVLRTTKSLARTMNQLAEEWYRQAIAWRRQAGGAVVLFDRHFFADYYAYDVIGGRAESTLPRRIHGFLLQHLYPQPDVIVYLDAPPEVLLARKGEGTIESLARRREDYLAMRDHVRYFYVVDATQSIERVAAEVAEVLGRHRHVRPKASRGGA
jgi:thymidylate kinase